MMRLVAFLAFLTLCANTASAQWLNHRTPGAPRTPDGKVNMAAPAPKTNGKPDFTGVWHVRPTPIEEMKRIYGDNVTSTDVPGMEADTISKYALSILADFKPEEAPMRPEAAAILRERLREGTTAVLPSTHCLPLGIPIAGLVSEMTKIVQAPTQMVILYESDNTHRQIYLDGRKLPKDPEPTWLGYSTGKWEGDALVVETAGFNDKGWLDVIGHPRSEALHLVERFRRRDFGHMDLQMTFDDPKMYTKPFTIQVTYELQPDTDVLESFCAENEKDRAHMGLK